MKTWQFLLPMAFAAVGFWACSEDNSTATECITSECRSEQPVPNPGEFPQNPDEPQEPGNPTNPESPENPEFPADTFPSKDTLPLEPPLIPGNEPLISSSGSSEPIVQSSSSSLEFSSSSEIIEDIEEPEIPAATPFKEDFRDECPIGNIPNSINNAKLPDPFTTLSGLKVATKDDWKCRREEIGAMYEQIMFGEKPRKPQKVEGSLSGSTFTVKVTDKGKSASFTVTINGAGTKDKPKAAMIGFGGGFMGNTCGSLGGSLSGLDIAQIIFNPDNVAPENGGGKFYDLYSGSSAGTIMAWAWGISRLIDALENTPEAGIDVKHLGITGCSRWGKGSLAAGAFDARIALVVPQESGSGGASLWRAGAQVNRQKGKQFVQGLGSAATEGRWMRSTFRNYDGKENTLPFDQHMLVGMVAPRGLLILDNAGQEWLGEVPSNYCGQVSKEIFDALGATENYTYSQEGGHAHCSLPNGQFDEVKDFINKFLLQKEAKTGKIDYTKNTQPINYKKSDWVDWTTPSLK